jgi:phosphoglycolate phosphatase-like HAD superfamily hydrolase
MKVTDYQTLVFDCDGVVLDSNKVKTAAFYMAALPYGEEAAKGLVEYHVANGGISRYKKFEWFLNHIVSNKAGPKLSELLASYASEVREGLLNCEIAEGLFELRQKTFAANWLIVSGGDQYELREVFAARGLAELFDGGIFGSPDSKDEILARELDLGNIKKHALFLGDSRYDHVASSAANLDFVFLSYWTEFKGWQEYVTKNKLAVKDSLKFNT